MDIKFEKNGMTKTTQERFTKALEAEGWKVVEDKSKDVKKASKKASKK